MLEWTNPLDFSAPCSRGPRLPVPASDKRAIPSTRATPRPHSWLQRAPHCRPETEGTLRLSSLPSWHWASLRHQQCFSPLQGSPHLPRPEELRESPPREESLPRFCLRQTRVSTMKGQRSPVCMWRFGSQDVGSPCSARRELQYRLRMKGWIP